MTARKWFTPGTVALDGEQVPAKIWDPVTKTLVPPEGKWVDPGVHGGHWHRIVADGDGTLSDTAPEGHGE